MVVKGLIINCIFLGKRGADGRLSSAQTALMLQEETIRRLERERKVLNEKMLALETNFAQSEADRRNFREKYTKSQKSESRYEKEREAMRAQIDNAESRVTRMDLKRKALEGIFHENLFYVFHLTHLLINYSDRYLL